MFILGLTGQTGAGKSLVAERFEKNGFAVIDADEMTRLVESPGKPCVAELAKAFGDGILRADGSLDRKKLASVAFSDKTSVEKLNRITHPFILAQIREKIAELEKAGRFFVVLDAPTLFESGSERLCTKTLAVTAPEDIRLRRIIERDSLTLGQARERIKAQQNENFYTGRADFAIRNDSTLSAAQAAADRLASKIKNGLFVE